MRLPLILFLLAAAISKAADPACVEVERAHFYEGTIGDYSRAIEIYQAVADDFKSPRRWRAEAIFGLARCNDKEENYLAANKFYLKIVKEYGEFKSLADRAGDEILANSRMLAIDGGAVEDDDYIRLNDLSLVLDAFVENDELVPAKLAAGKIHTLVEKITKDVQGTPDESSFADLLKEIVEIEKTIAANDGKKARRLLLDAPELGEYIDGAFLPDPGELFDPALRWKDRVAYALAENETGNVTKFCKRIENYLAPLTDSPNKYEKSLADSLLTAAVKIRHLAEAGDMPGARLALYETDLHRAENVEFISIYFEDFEDAPTKFLPKACLAMSQIEHAASLLDTDQSEARQFLEKAKQQISSLQPNAKGVTKDVVKSITEALDKSLVELDAGNIDAVRNLLEMDDI